MSTHPSELEPLFTEPLLHQACQAGGFDYNDSTKVFFDWRQDGLSCLQRALEQALSLLEKKSCHRYTYEQIISPLYESCLVANWDNNVGGPLAAIPEQKAVTDSTQASIRSNCAM